MKKHKLTSKEFENTFGVPFKKDALPVDWFIDLKNKQTITAVTKSSDYIDNQTVKNFIQFNNLFIHSAYKQWNPEFERYEYQIRYYILERDDGVIIQVRSTHYKPVNLVDNYNPPNGYRLVTEEEKAYCVKPINRSTNNILIKYFNEMYNCWKNVMIDDTLPVWYDGNIYCIKDDYQLKLIGKSISEIVKGDIVRFVGFKSNDKSYQGNIMMVDYINEPFIGLINLSTTNYYNNKPLKHKFKLDEIELDFPCADELKEVL